VTVELTPGTFSEGDHSPRWRFAPDIHVGDVVQLHGPDAAWMTPWEVARGAVLKERGVVKLRLSDGRRHCQCVILRTEVACAQSHVRAADLRPRRLCRVRRVGRAGRYGVPPNPCLTCK